MQQYKIQNRSKKKSQSCVPLTKYEEAVIHIWFCTRYIWQFFFSFLLVYGLALSLVYPRKEKGESLPFAHVDYYLSCGLFLSTACLGEGWASQWRWRRRGRRRSRRQTSSRAPSPTPTNKKMQRGYLWNTKGLYFIIRHIHEVNIRDGWKSVHVVFLMNILYVRKPADKWGWGRPVSLTPLINSHSQWDTQGTRGTLIYEKTLSKKFRVRLPLKDRLLTLSSDS